MPTAICIECDGAIQIHSDAELLDLVACEDCGTEFEVVGLQPLEIDYVDDADDDDDDEEDD